jgi:transposase-like protein
LHAFLDLPFIGEWPYLWLDATYLKQRQSGSIFGVAAIIAVIANTDRKPPKLHFATLIKRLDKEVTRYACSVGIIFK